MDQDTAKMLLSEGGVLVVLEMPVGAEFGIDYNTWTVGPRFRGVKMIPPGLHFVYFSAVDTKTKSTAPRTGFFQWFEKRQIVVKKWNTATEDMDDEVLTAEQHDTYRQGLMEMDRFLGAYPFDDSLRTWMALTGFIRPADVARLQPSSGRICSVPESEPLPANATSAAAVEESCRPALHAAIRFTAIPRTLAPPNASPATVTQCSVDRTYTLDTLLHTVFSDDWSALLAELQFAFVSFLMGQVFEGFEHWKMLLHLLCSCDEALVRHTALYRELIGVLHYQLKETPQDFFVDIVSRNNFLTTCLQSLFSRVSHMPVDEALARRVAAFQKSITKYFSWDFDVEPDDEQPVVVEQEEG